MQSATLKALPTCLFADLAEDLKGNQSTEKRPKLVFLGGLNVVQVSMDFEIFSEGLWYIVLISFYIPFKETSMQNMKMWREIG